MAGKANDALARMRQVATADKPPRRRPTTLAGERVRITVDLDPARHRALKLYALDQRVQASRVIRALLDLLAGDAEVARQVARRLAEDPTMQ